MRRRSILFIFVVISTNIATFLLSNYSHSIELWFSCNLNERKRRLKTHDEFVSLKEKPLYLDPS